MNRAVNHLRNKIIGLTKSTLFYVVVLIVIAIVTHIDWFRIDTILAFGDWQYRTDENARQLITSWATWVPFDNLGNPNILISGYPLRGLLWSLPAWLGLSFDFATKISVFIPVAIGVFLAPFFLVYKWTSNRVIAFVLALFYGSNTYILIIQTAHLPIGIVYALAPIYLYVFDIALRINRLKHWVFLALLTTIGIVYEVRIMYIVFLSLLVYALVYIAYEKINPLKYVVNSIMAGLVIFALNIFWIIPTKMGSGSAISNVAGRGLFGDDLFTLQQAFTLMKWNWTGGLVDRYFVSQPIPTYLWLIPLIALGGIIFWKRLNRTAIYFVVLLAIGLFISKQSDAPLAGAYEWLYENFPGFILFREASKFYLLVALGYLGVLMHSLLALRVASKAGKGRYLYGIAMSAVLMVSFLNLAPAFTRDLGGTFKAATLPLDDIKIKNLLENEHDFSRVLWYPKDSQWGLSSNLHPRLEAIDVLATNWKDSVSKDSSDDPIKMITDSGEIIGSKFFEWLLANSAVKYAIVPDRDIENDNDLFFDYGDDRQYFVDMLSQVDSFKTKEVGTKNAKVFETGVGLPYIRSISQPFNLPSNDDVTTYFNFVEKHLSVPFNYEQAAANNQLGAQLVDLFGLLSKDKINGSQVRISIPTASQAIFVRKPAEAIRIIKNPLDLNIIQEPQGSLVVDGEAALGGDAVVASTRVPLPEDQLNYIETAGKYYLVSELERESSFGALAAPISLTSARKTNLVPNPSFEEGAWKSRVIDCNQYDDKGKVAMELAEEFALDGRKSLKLTSSNHIACTTTDQIPVQALGDYLLSANFKGINTNRWSLEVEFDNGVKQREYIQIVDNKWHNFTKVISAPNDAKSAKIWIKAYPNEHHKGDAHTYFDSVSLNEVVSSNLVYQPKRSEYKRLPVSTNKDARVATFAGPTFSATNLIPNPSLEAGLWQKEVNDCNAYDDRPEIKMSLDSKSKSEGMQSLVLKAKRHIACTGPSNIKVAEGGFYKLSFDYQSPNSRTARVFVGFDDKDSTHFVKDIVINDREWNTFTKTIKVPVGAKKMRLVVYALANARGDVFVTNRYDNFQFYRVPELMGDVISMSRPPEFGIPKAVAYEYVNATSKKVVVKSAPRYFYLAMSEAYDSNWRLGTEEGKGIIDAINPFGRTPEGDGVQQFKLNGYFNGWRVDAKQVCSQSKDCSQNEDGSYNFTMDIDFVPQRWFNLGLVASGVSLVIVCVYLGLTSRRKKSDSVLVNDVETLNRPNQPVKNSGTFNRTRDRQQYNRRKKQL